MGWFKSAEEKAAEKREKELVEKYGEKDGLRIFENKISEKKYLEEKEEKKKKAAQQKEKAAKKNIMDWVVDENNGVIKLWYNFFHGFYWATDQQNIKWLGDFDWREDKGDFLLCEHPISTEMSATKFIELLKELIEEDQLFTYSTWNKGEKALPGWLVEHDYYSDPVHIFTKSYGVELIQEEQKYKDLIIELLTKKSIKMTISDITAHIKHDKREHVKSMLENMHKDGDIDFAGSGRYFIYSEKKKTKKTKTKSAKVEKSDKVDVKSELKKYKGMLDEGLITQEQYDAKSNELLGL